VAVDIPIGLAKGGSRVYDTVARRVLGRLRGSSVFSAPDPQLLNTVVEGALDHAEASEHSRSIFGKGISKRAFAIFPKIAETNGVMIPEQERVIEIHPKVSFWALAGRPMEHRKGIQRGFEERRDHLSGALEGVGIPTRQKAGAIASPAKADDVLDAIVATWTAKRFAEGRSNRLPPAPPADARGLRMEMVY
jgi:predicted RNase H-like nuclease